MVKKLLTYDVVLEPGFSNAGLYELLDEKALKFYASYYFKVGKNFWIRIKLNNIKNAQ